MTPAELIAQLYVGYYNRAPDPEGLAYWEGRIAAGVSLSDIADSFAASPEAVGKYPFFAMENPTEGQVGAFLQAVYRNLFNRDIDPDGLEFYSNQLLTGERRPGEIIASIQANANTNTNNTDGTILGNKVEVALAWTAAARAQAGFEFNAETRASAETILIGVGAEQSSVDDALADVEEFFDAPASLEGGLEALLAARAAVAAQDQEIADFLETTYDNEFVEALVTTDVNADGDIDAEDVTDANVRAAEEDAADALVTAGGGNVGGVTTGAAFVALADGAQEARIEAERADFDAAIETAQDNADTSADALEDDVAALAAEAQERAEELEEALDAREAQSDATSDVLDAASAVASDSDTSNNDVSFSTTATAGVIVADEAVVGTSEAITEIDNGAVRFTNAVALNAAGTAYVITLDSGETSTISKTFLDQLLVAAQADFAAANAVESAENALATTIVDALEAQDSTFDGSAVDYASLVSDGAISASGNGLGTDATVVLDYAQATDNNGGGALTVDGGLINDYDADLTTLADLQDGLVEFNEAVAEYQATKALVDQLDALLDQRGDLVTAENRAQLQITNDENGDPAGLDVDLFEGAAAAFNAGDDVYLFEEGTGATITGFGVSGEDSIYFGGDYTLVALGDDDITDNVGSVSALEIFWEETAGGDLVLYVENETFGGNGSTTADLTTITLVGVTAEDVNLSGGFLASV